jgi:hypothetical protein
VPVGAEPENEELGGFRVEEGEALATANTNSTDSKTVKVERDRLFKFIFIINKNL